jgi:predicted nuclease of predicted toxin-antitoxin system
LRFLLDECMPIYVRTLLRERGHDVFDPREMGMRGADDKPLLEIAAHFQIEDIRACIQYAMEVVARVH